MEREALPIKAEDLDKWIATAERSYTLQSTLRKSLPR